MRFATKGSQRWLQVAVNRRPETMNAPLREAIGASDASQFTWISPLAADRFGEYRDQACLRKLGIAPAQPLSEFWPSRGAVWDGLAHLDGHGVVLVEAKAHIPEMISSPSKATKDSKTRIDAALRRVQQDLAPKATIDWSGTFYQYTNRIAFLYYLRVMNRVPAHLAFVYFVNAPDVAGPTSREEWLGAIRLVKGYLGLGRHKLSRFVHDIFVDVASLREAAS